MPCLIQQNVYDAEKATRKQWPTKHYYLSGTGMKKTKGILGAI